MDVSSIANMSMAMSQTKLLQDVGTAVMDMALESQAMSLGDMTQSLETMVNPDIGSNIDISV